MNFRTFDAVSFLKASRHWIKYKRRLQQELEDMPMLPAGGDNSGIRGSDPSELTARLALRRLKIKAEIEEIERHEEMLAYALNSLTEDEREVINGFFFSRKSKGAFVDEYKRKHGLNKNHVYDERLRILKKIGRLIDEKYYEGE